MLILRWDIDFHVLLYWVFRSDIDYCHSLLLSILGMDIRYRIFVLILDTGIVSIYGMTYRMLIFGIDSGYWLSMSDIDFAAVYWYFDWILYWFNILILSIQIGFGYWSWYWLLLFTLDIWFWSWRLDIDTDIGHRYWCEIGTGFWYWYLILI